MQGQDLKLDDRNLVDDCRRGDASACRLLIGRHENYALRFAFLLTNDGQQAISLASSGLVRLLQQSSNVGADWEFQPQLLLEIICQFLKPDVAIEQGQEPPAMRINIARRQHFTVDTQRARTRQALLRLEPPIRAALVLREFGRIALTDIAPCVELAATELESALLHIYERLRTNASLTADQSLAGALSAAALDAPRADLWELIEQGWHERLVNERQRTRLINGSAIALVAVMAALVIGLLLTGRLASGEDGEKVALNSLPDRPAPTLAPVTILPTATQTAVADVSDVFLLTNRSRGSGSTAIFQPVADSLTTALPLQNRDHLVEAAPPVISPDGKQVIILWYEYTDTTMRAIATAFNHDLDRLLWQAEVIPAQPVSFIGEAPSILMVAAVNSKHVYVVLHHWDSGLPVEILLLNVATGDRQSTIKTKLAGFAAHDIRVYAPPGLDAIYLFTISQEAPAEDGQLQMVFLAYRSDGRPLHAKSLSDKADSRILFLYSSQITPDGQGLFGVEYTALRHEVAVHFFDLKRGTVARRVALPFEPVADPIPYQQAVSHDGHWLYVLSPASREVAIVDLQLHKLQGIIPLDMGVLAGETVETTYFADLEMQLSPDGHYLYAIGSATTGNNGSAHGIWVIDITSWTIIDRWLPDIQPGEILIDGNDDQLFVRASTVPPLSGESRLHVIDLKSGNELDQVTLKNSGYALYSLTALYRGLYGHSPQIDGQHYQDTLTTSTLATMDVTVDPQRLVAGDRVQIDIRFVDPLTGNPVSGQARSGATRYTPPAAIQVVLTNDANGVTLLLNPGPVAAGRYSGTIAIPAAGTWSVRVDATWPDGGPEPRTVLKSDTLRAAENQRLQKPQNQAGEPGTM